MPFEVSGLNVNVNAHCHLREFDSPTNAPEVPTAPPPPGTIWSNKMIQKDQAFQILFHWTQNGPGVFAIGAGDWLLEVFLEKMGPGEAPVPKGYFKVSIPGVGNPGFYAKEINVPAGTVDPGIYRVVCSMQLVVGNVPKALAGFDDLGLIRVYDES